MLQLLLGPMGGGDGGKGPDSPSENSAMASSPPGLSLSPLPSPLNMASMGTAGPLSPSRSASLHSRAEVDQRTQSRRKINTPPKVAWSHTYLFAVIVGYIDLCVYFVMGLQVLQL
jgi:hypothetical protein